MKFIIHEAKEFLCDDCETPLGNLSGWPYYSKNNDNYCPDCALRRGLIGANEWLFAKGIDCYHHAEYENGTITAYQKCGRGYHKDVVKLSDCNAE
ncbi:MAG: hypothetical protein LUF78_07560 [Clostridiales bacterium]|nr:hypothetical protein [Clostridiales bacterium]